MADYEVLAPGGHARLVSDVKSYADRAGGKGTTQLADGSVTRDKLADGVTDRIDAMRDRCDPLVGNYFFNELAEGTVLTADDAYAAPPKDVEVYGKSTQVTTTGKNLWDDARYASVGWTKSSDSLYHGYIKSFCDGILDLGNGDYPESTQVTICLNIVRMGNSGTIRLRFDYTDGTSSETSNISSSKLHYTYTSTAGKTVSAARITTSAGSSNDNFRFSYIQVGVGVDPSAYEPYSGGSPSPSPDYPQPISSVDDLAILLMGKNILDPSTIEQGTLIYGHNFASDSRCRTDAKIPVVAGSSIVMSGTSSSGTLEYFAAFYKSGIFETNGVGWVAIGQAITVPSGVDECRLAFRNSDESAIVPSDLTNIQLEYGSTATAYTPYVGQSVEIPLSNNSLRSLPDGTRDELTLSYVGPSTEHEGWGVFGASLKQYVGSIVKTTATSISDQSTWQRVMTSEISGAKPIKNTSPNAANRLISHFTYKYTAYNYGTEGTTNSVCFNFAPNTFATLADAQAWFAENQVEVLYDLATPQTIDLGTVELPVNPAPELTAWADGGSAQPTLSMSYEQDINIVFARLNDAISDLATA